MKHYVLDEPAPVSAPPSEADRAPPRRWAWRALLLLAVVEPLALSARCTCCSAPKPSAVAATTADEAWQAVFGSVANYAISCTQRGCAVWIAALAKAQPSRGAVAAPAAPASEKGDTEEDTTSPSPETTTVAVRIAAPAAAQNVDGEAVAEN